jgi:hypothetical protein
MDFPFIIGSYRKTSSFWDERRYPKTNQSEVYKFSISKKLKNENKINDEFEIMLDNLKLEEVIALKLETSSKVIGGKLFGLPLWHSLTDIVRDAVFKYALSASKNKKEAIKFLGLTFKTFCKNSLRYDIADYMGSNLFKKEEK